MPEAANTRKWPQVATTTFTQQEVRDSLDEYLRWDQDVASCLELQGLYLALGY